jgi:hypothetical protein
MPIAQLSTQLPPVGPILDIPMAGPVAGAQAGAVLITAPIVNILAETTINDGVRLPPTVGGESILVTNFGALQAMVYPSGTEFINATAPGGGLGLAAGSAALFACPKQGQWRRFVQG